MEDAAEVASTRWRRLCAGDEETTVLADGPGPAAASAAGNLVSAVGTEDVEHPRGPPKGSALHLQQDLTKIADRCVAAGLVERMRSQERWSDLHRLEDLSPRMVVGCSQGQDVQA